MTVQSTFESNVIHALGAHGKEWLDSIPRKLASCSEKWQITIFDPYELSFNYVAPAITKGGQDLVVKLCLPDGYTYEKEALLALRGDGLVQLVDDDDEQNVLLLERFEPGTTLASVPLNKEASHIAASLLGKITKPVLTETKLPTTLDRQKSLVRTYQQHPNGFGPLTKNMLLKANRLFSYLHQTSTKQYVLHGDFHHGNILLTKDGSWKAIDPKGLIGEREYDVVQFMLNQLPEDNRLDCLHERINLFVLHLALDRKRLLFWCYAHTVLATSWTIGEDGSYNETFYNCIYLFDQLITQSRATYERDDDI